MTDDELSQQMNLLRTHLQEEPNDIGAAENLSVLESVAYERQHTAREAPGPAAVPQKPAVAPVDPVSVMSATDKLIEAYHRARIDNAVRAKFESLVTPKALVIAIISFAVAFVASQFTPVGWAADIALGLTAVFVATSLFAAINHLVNFAEARNATSSAEIDAAGQEFAAAVAELEVDAILFLITHGIGGGRGGPPLEVPPPATVRLGVTPEGFAIPVAAETVPATVSVTTAGAIGVKAIPITGPLLSVGSGPGGGGGRLPVPPVPKGVKNLNEFGTKIMKWGTGSAEARARMATLSRAELEQGGVTREMAEAWRDFYRNEMVRNRANPSAPGRADLMQRAVELLGEGPP
jgi:hypothetical protein